MKVAAIGDNCIDLYEKLNRYYATGNAVDFAVNMQKLGIDTAVISTTGNDEYGKIMRKTLEEQGIDLSHFYTGEGATARVLYGSGGSGAYLSGIRGRCDGECGVYTGRH